MRVFAYTAVLTAALNILYGFEINENDLFSEPVISSNTGSTGSNASHPALDRLSDSTPEKSAAALGGALMSRALYSVHRNTVYSNHTWDTNQVRQYFEIGLDLEVRLPKGFKSYVDFLIYYSPAGIHYTNYYFLQGSPYPGYVAVPASQYFSFSLNEFFFDCNAANAVWMRLGMQVLKWGRGMLWNPSDLINWDKKSFEDMNRQRRGVTGIKVHIPVKTYFNFYSFINMDDVEKPNNYTYALKTEALLGGMEAALGCLLKKTNHTVWTLDFSKGLRGWNFYGEGAYLPEYTKTIYRVSGTNVTNYQPDKQTGKVVLGVHKSFNKDKCTAAIEGYYNGEGYNFNVYRHKIYTTITNTNSAYLTDNRMELNRWYAAAFFSWTGLFRQTTTLTCNALCNLNDRSFILTPQLTFSPVDQFSISLMPVLYPGKSRRSEFTSRDVFSEVFLDVKIVF